MPGATDQLIDVAAIADVPFILTWDRLAGTLTSGGQDCRWERLKK
jgi:hypothetical protein